MAVDACGSGSGYEQDGRLLRAYIRSGANRAFDDLVRRHAGMVYATCLRELGDHDLAEDASQTVFLLLVRKAAGLRRQASVAAWLFQAARLTARDVRKQEARRHRREAAAAAEQARQAMERETDAERAFWVRTERSAAEALALHTEDGAGSQDRSDDADAEQAFWEQTEPLLNGALASLSERDREPILLRFMEGLSLAQTGEALGATEDAARMRVNRALGKMRRYLQGSGAATTESGLSSALVANAQSQAPAWLARTGQSALLHTSSRLIAAGRTGRAMSWLRWKAVGLATVGGVVVLGGVGITVNRVHMGAATAAMAQVEKQREPASTYPPAPAPARSIASYHAVIRFMKSFRGGMPGSGPTWERAEEWYDAKRGIYTTRINESQEPPRTVIPYLVLPDGTSTSRFGDTVYRFRGRTKQDVARCVERITDPHMERRSPEARLASTEAGQWKQAPVTVYTYASDHRPTQDEIDHQMPNMTRMMVYADVRSGLMVAMRAYAVDPSGKEVVVEEGDVDYTTRADPAKYDAAAFTKGAHIVDRTLGKAAPPAKRK